MPSPREWEKLRSKQNESFTGSLPRMNPITFVVIMVAVSLILRSFAKSSKQAPRIDESGKKVLRLPLLYEIIGWTSLVVIGVLMTAIFLFSAKSTNDASDIAGDVISIIVFGFFCFLGVLLILNRRKSIIVFDDEKIEAHYIFAKEREILWKAVTKAEFSHGSKSLKFTDGKQKIGVGYSMIGFQSLLDEMQKQLTPQVLGDSLQKVQSFYKRMGLSQ
jgi:hypothetical protein